MICGYYGTQYRVRFYPFLGYSILYKEYDLTRFNHRKNTTHWCNIRVIVGLLGIMENRMRTTI